VALKGRAIKEMNMSSYYNIFALVTTAVASLGVSYVSQSGENYSINKTSPNGAYRVKVEVRAEEGRETTRGYIEHVKVEFLKGQEIINSYESRNPYQYEPTFHQAWPVIEWVSDSVLRMGQDRSDQPFYDELVLSNNTNEPIKYVGISYGRFESFWIFDLASKGQITLRASPRFKPDHSSNYFLGYSGVTESGKKFEGTGQSKQRKGPSDGPLKLQITINNNDLR